MKKFFAVLLALCMIFALAACGSNDSTETTDTQTEETAAVDDTQTQETETDTQEETETVETSEQVQETVQDASGEGALGEYYIKITGCDYADNDEGYTSIIITYEFTNNSATAVAPASVLTCQAFQDGMSLSAATISGSSLYDNGNAMAQTVEPGATVTCQAAYTQSSDASIEFDVTESLSSTGSKVYAVFEAAA